MFMSTGAFVSASLSEPSGFSRLNSLFLDLRLQPLFSPKAARTGHLKVYADVII